jgi:hypothetical protein
MPALSELELQILAEVEEGGPKDVAAVMNALFQVVTGEAALMEIELALENLVRADLVRMSMSRDACGRLQQLSRDESLDAIADLHSGLRRKSGRWLDTRHSAPQSGDLYPYIVCKENRSEAPGLSGQSFWRRKK